MSSKDQDINLFTYAGIIKFGKDNSKIKLNKKELIIFVLVFAAIFAILDFIFGTFF